MAVGGAREASATNLSGVDLGPGYYGGTRLCSASIRAMRGPTVQARVISRGMRRKSELLCFLRSLERRFETVMTGLRQYIPQSVAKIRKEGERSGGIPQPIAAVDDGANAGANASYDAAFGGSAMAMANLCYPPTFPVFYDFSMIAARAVLSNDWHVDMHRFRITRAPFIRSGAQSSSDQIRSLLATM
jgi:hypothetical protein